MREVKCRVSFQYALGQLQSPPQVVISHWQNGLYEESKQRYRERRRFFFRPGPQLPKKEMSQHARENAVSPAWELSHFVAVQPELSFGFLEALLYSPPDVTQPDEGLRAVFSGALLLKKE